MPIATLDITIDQGYPWEALLVFPEERFVSAFLRGQLRKRNHSSEVLAEFQFGSPRYSSETKLVEVTILLPEYITQGLPPTGVDLWVYDVTARLRDRSSYVILAGSVQVWETVTREEFPIIANVEN